MSFHSEARNFYMDNPKISRSQTWVTDNLGIGATPSSVSTSRSDKKLLSYFARGNYNFDNRYLFTATIRADGSTVFSAKNKWGYFPSFSAAWRVSEEKYS